MTRQISPAGLHLIASFEGFVPSPYDDSRGFATIGYGHLISPQPVDQAIREAWGTITVDRGLELLRGDAQIAVDAVNRTVEVRLALLPSRAQARFDALCSLAYNIGGGALEGSTLLRLINERGAPRDWTTLGPYWLEWDHAGAAVIPGLLSRRRLEFGLYVTGRYPIV